MKTNSIIVIVLILSFAYKSQAQFVFSEKEEAIQNSILDLNFVDIQISTKTTSNGILNWLSAYQTFIKFETSSQLLSPDSVIAEIEHQKAAIELLETNSPYYHYCLADIYLMTCYIHYENNDLLKAFSAYINAQNQITSNEKEFPNFPLNQKHLLILKTTDDWVSVNVFGKNNGGNEFWKKEFQNYWTEAKNRQKMGSVGYREIDLLGYCLQLLFADISTESFSGTVIPSHDFSTKGPLESFVISMILGKMEQYPQKLEVLAQADSLGYTHRFNSLNLWYGIALLNNNSVSSLYYLKVFIKNQKNNKQVNYGRLKLAWHFLANHQPKLADSLVTIISKSGQKDVWDDRQAKYEVVHASEWLPEIIQSRLCFDGGNYSSSIDILLSLKNEVKSFNQQQKLEYAYRLARAYQKLGQTNKAIPFYQMAVNSNLDSEFYYPAYSAFYLGEIFEQAHNNKDAETYYNICLQLDSPIYKADIHKRAKLAKTKLE